MPAPTLATIRGVAFIATLLATILAPLKAQADKDARAAAVTAKAVATLEAFAKRAVRWKAMTHGRRAYRVVIDHYDPDHAVARKLLGYEKKAGDWQRVKDPATLPPNKASKTLLKQAVKAWQTTSAQLTELHRELGLALVKEGNTKAGHHHLKRAIAFAPDDRLSHEALGHDNILGYYGTDQQLKFVRRMQAMLKKAKECAALDFATTVLAKADMPTALSASGLPFQGARSKHFEHWVIGTETQAQQSLVWAERALVMVRHLLGEQPLTAQALTPDARAYLAILRTDKQRDQLLARSPVTLGDYDVIKAKLFSGVSYQENGKWAEWAVCGKDDDQDRVVGHVMMRCAAQRLNPSMSEGLVHALTWMMCGTVKTHYMQLAHTASNKRDAWPADPLVWRLRLEAELANDADWPLIQIPRERMDNFRDPVRAKSWCFCVWLLARHHEDWLDLCAALNQPNATQDDVQGLFGETLGLDVEECEAEWRMWARKHSSIGKASGW